VLLRPGHANSGHFQLKYANIQSGNHLKEMSVDNHGSVRFVPATKTGFSFCLKQGKIFVACVLGWKKGELPWRQRGQWLYCSEKWVAADRSVSLCFVLCTMIPEKKSKKKEQK